MRSVALSIATLVAFLITASGSAAQPNAVDPLSAYKEYLAVLAKATTLEPLIPYYTKELGDGLRKMPKDMQANYLKANKRVISDFKVTKQQIGADKASFQLSGKDSAGQDLTGTADLVKEGSVWKVDDWTWVGPPPKF
jgi:hypothetical protein